MRHTITFTCACGFELTGSPRDVFVCMGWHEEECEIFDANIIENNE